MDPRKFLSENWLAFAGLVIALFGGVPWLVDVYRGLFAAPELVVAEAMAIGAIAEDQGVRPRVRLVALTLSNSGSEALVPIKCELYHDHDGRLDKFEPMALPSTFEADVPSTRINLGSAAVCGLHAKRFVLEKGRPVEGLMFFVAADPPYDEDISYRDPELKLSRRDALGDTYEASFTPKAPPPSPLPSGKTTTAGGCIKFSGAGGAG